MYTEDYILLVFNIYSVFITYKYIFAYMLNVIFELQNS